MQLAQGFPNPFQYHTLSFNNSCSTRFDLLILIIILKVSLEIGNPCASDRLAVYSSGLHNIAPSPPIHPHSPFWQCGVEEEEEDEEEEENWRGM